MDLSKATDEQIEKLIMLTQEMIDLEEKRTNLLKKMVRGYQYELERRKKHDR